MGISRTSDIRTSEVGKAGNADVTYDDMYGAVSAARVPAANAPSWENITLDGFTTQALAFDVGEYIDIFVQTNHSMQLNQAFENHIHWTLASDDDGDEIRFQLTGVGAGIGESFSSIGTLDTGDIVLAGNAGKHNYLEIGEVPSLNTTVSSVYILRLQRVAVNDGNDSAELVYILFNDSHMKIDTLGSLQEDSKV